MVEVSVGGVPMLFIILHNLPRIRLSQCGRSYEYIKNSAVVDG